MATPPKHAASLEEIAQAEGMSIAAVHMMISRALRKLRSQGLVFTARQLALELESRRATENSMYQRNGRRAGAE
jgi:hypothetical protein